MKMGIIIPPHQLTRATRTRPLPFSRVLPQHQLRTVAAFRNQKPNEASQDALGMVGTPKHRSRANDGTVSWSKLNTGEKLLRSTQQSFNAVVILAGAALTLGIATLLYTEVFSPSSKTAQFNHAVDKIRGSRECVDALCGSMGTGSEIKAYGETTWNRWSRNRPVAARVEVDKLGVEHMRMRFYVEGKRAKGVVQVHMVRRPGEGEGRWEYHMLAVDVPGRERIWVENKERSVGVDKKGGKMFGVKWW